MKRILLIGYGKMGQAIEKIALERGNQIAGIVDVSRKNSVSDFSSADVDVAIEFTQPTSAFDNICACIEAGIPVVSGTTGWLDKRDQVEALAKEKNGAFFYASNFSIGVNLFFDLNERLAKLMNGFDSYNVEMEEIHHIHKLDAPSGTAITLAEGVFEHIDRKNNWSLDKETKPSDVAILHKREGEVPGTHVVTYSSEIDTIEIKHEAHSRQGFATGAVVAAEWLAGKQGVFGMKDLLNL